MSEPGLLIAPELGHGWTCFHCGDHFPADFRGQRAAAVHFGTLPDRVPGCITKMNGGEKRLLWRIRLLEDELRELRARVAAEDTDADRRMAAMASEYGAALRDEEEKGYARGVADRRREMENALACPFCMEGGFDAVGLKAHLFRWCAVFGDIETLAQEHARARGALRSHETTEPQ